MTTGTGIKLNLKITKIVIAVRTMNDLIIKTCFIYKLYKMK
jgi:hypothetical protein